ncbi:hypothetical protein B0H16DRAFT_1702645 [Mycena metata]|uniref:Uncharacterized protein n=1 Tax=Mycena metata TaxID=1033252 RepID=A0AAD7H694_9AGAR|nr:hypothetical protein B0H16DRAFT_1702645 [Mycena metata]
MKTNGDTKKGLCRVNGLAEVECRSVLKPLSLKLPVYPNPTPGATQQAACSPTACLALPDAYGKRREPDLRTKHTLTLPSFPSPPASCLALASLSARLLGQHGHKSSAPFAREGYPIPGRTDSVAARSVLPTGAHVPHSRSGFDSYSPEESATAYLPRALTSTLTPNSKPAGPRRDSEHRARRHEDDRTAAPYGPRDPLRSHVRAAADVVAVCAHTLAPTPTAGTHSAPPPIATLSVLEGHRAPTTPAPGSPPFISIACGDVFALPLPQRRERRRRHLRPSAPESDRGCGTEAAAQDGQRTRCLLQGIRLHHQRGYHARHTPPEARNARDRYTRLPGQETKRKEEGVDIIEGKDRNNEDTLAAPARHRPPATPDTKLRPRERHETRQDAGHDTPSPPLRVACLTEQARQRGREGKGQGQILAGDTGARRCEAERDKRGDEDKIVKEERKNNDGKNGKDVLPTRPRLLSAGLGSNEERDAAYDERIEGDAQRPDVPLIVRANPRLGRAEIVDALSVADVLPSLEVLTTDESVAAGAKDKLTLEVWLESFRARDEQRLLGKSILLCWRTRDAGLEGEEAGADRGKKLVKSPGIRKINIQEDEGESLEDSEMKTPARWWLKSKSRAWQCDTAGPIAPVQA